MMEEYVILHLRSQIKGRSQVCVAFKEKYCKELKKNQNIVDEMMATHLENNSMVLYTDWKRGPTIHPTLFI